MPSTRRVMILPLVQLPAISGVVSDVMLSVAERPVSLQSVRSGSAGALGGVVSIKKGRAVEPVEVFPAASVTVVVAW
jgi:hypothetical protein